MDVVEIKRQAQKDAGRKKTLYNSSRSDFVFHYDGKKFVIPSRDFKEFSLPLYRHAKKHLIDHILNIVHTGKGRPSEKLRQEIIEEIEVNV